MLTKPAKWNIISLGSLFSIWAKKCFELWLKNMCTSRICSNELCIILQMKQFWLLLGQIEKNGLLLFRHLVPLPIYRPIFVHVYSVDSLSLSISLSMSSLPLCLSQPFYIVFVFLISNLTAISFRYLLFPLRMTQLSQQKLSAQNEHLCQFKFLFGKAVAALPRNRHRLKEYYFRSEIQWKRIVNDVEIDDDDIKMNEIWLKSAAGALRTKELLFLLLLC